MRRNKLIILRGPSGSGKTTIAQALHRTARKATLIIEQDYYQQMLLAETPDTKRIVAKMVYTDTMIVLRAGYNVILEGVFRKEKYLPVLRRLIQDFDGRTYLYYFAISLDETVKRHATRPKAALFGAKEMAGWYVMAKPLRLPGEQIITEDLTAETTLRFIQKQTRL